MGDFSEVVKTELQNQNITIASLAAAIGFSDKYVYDLLKRRNGSRWNEDSMRKACEFLKIKTQFTSTGDVEEKGSEQSDES